MAKEEYVRRPHAPAGRSLPESAERVIPGMVPPPPPAKWMKLLELIQFMWEHVTIPTYLGWTILVLISNGNTYN